MTTRKAILVVADIGCFALLMYFIYNFEYMTWDFRNNLWGPAYLLVHGRSPYNITPLFKDNGIAVWFPQIIGVFFPLGYLPYFPASNLWLLLNTLAIFGMTIHVIRQSVPQTHLRLYGLILLSVFLFPPTANNLMLGQMDYLLIATFLATAWGINQQNVIVPAFSLAIALSKPQLCAVVMPSVFIWLALTRKWNYGIRLFILLSVFVLGLTLPLWIADRYWLQDFAQNLNQSLHWLQPALFTQLKLYYGQVGVVLWLAVALACIGISVMIWKRFPPERAIVWSMALTTIAAPYVWSWDFTLLLPLFVDTFARLTKSYARAVLLALWLFCVIFSNWTLQFQWSDERLWWMPFVMLLGILLAIKVQGWKYKDPLARAEIHPE